MSAGRHPLETLVYPTRDAVHEANREHDLVWWLWRWMIRLWQWLFLDPPAPPPSDPVLARGHYLVDALGHCGECHTPRDMFGGTQYGAWLSGAPAATGDGTIPNITPGGDVGGWSEDEIAEYLNSGFTPDFDSAGGEMVSVIKNLANLEPEDRAAIAAYLKQVPSLPNGHP